MKSESKKVKIESLVEGDTFAFDGNIYTLIKNEQISRSFNELHVKCEDEDNILRIKKETSVWLDEVVNVRPKPSEAQSIIEKIRNDRGILVSVKFIPINERKLSKAEIKSRDKCADDLLSNPKFVKRYSDGDNVKPPGKNIDDVAYGTCTNRVTGRGNKTKEKKKKETNESFNRLNTLRKAIRRTFE
jgi:hypothetical protein|tara:strand:+ start:892 stop:1452 length:561 start_codon:yes stop_codon:yes gene_type:complete